LIFEGWRHQRYSDLLALCHPCSKQPEVRFTAIEYISPKSQKGYACLRVNFSVADAALKAKLEALGMRWAVRA
jgi:hypothetical protein